MINYQIILLPRQHYWDWVRASRRYAMAYHAYITQDPETAVRNNSSNQAVTVILPPEGYPAQGNIAEWVRHKLPGVMVDVIEAVTPQALEVCFGLRVDTDNRFGEVEKPFKLLWPTDYAVVTQPFGANPAIYRPMGMPGHEGVDIRAPMNANIYASADGEVYFVNNNPQAHNYGIHIRLKHTGGYRTVYAHLTKTLVAEGDVVKVGQVIGKADSTGNSSGSHLHLSLKKDGATDAKLTIYPKDIIDPTPFLVWPQKKEERKGIHSKEIPSRCLVGLDASQQIVNDLELHELISESRFEAVKIQATVPGSTIEQLKWKFPGIFITANLHLPVPQLTKEIYEAHVKPVIDRLHSHEVLYLELFSQPNVSFNGWGKYWSDGKSFSALFLTLSEWIKTDYPEMKLGFPGISTGERIEGIRQEWRIFLEQCDTALHQADWVGVDLTWKERDQLNHPDHGAVHQTYRLWLPEKPLIITQFWSSRISENSPAKGEDYLAFYENLQHKPGYLAAFLSLHLSDDQKQKGIISTMLGRRL